MNKQPELEIDVYGNKRWKLNGLFHREDGPAYECISGSKQWLLNGELHRVDGPAIERRSGYKAWCLNGKKYSFDEWFQALTPEQQYNYLWNIDE
jgi:hypothetical protein